MQSRADFFEPNHRSIELPYGLLPGRRGRTFGQKFQELEGLSKALERGAIFSLEGLHLLQVVASHPFRLEVPLTNGLFPHSSALFDKISQMGRVGNAVQ